VGQVEQMRPLGVVELEGAGDGVQDTSRDPGQGASLQLGVILDAHPGQGGDSLRRNPGTRRLVPAGRLACAGVILARRETRNSRAS
jgi:hypothetical protein